MKLLLAGIAVILIVETNAQWFKFPIEAAQGTYDMGRAYFHMREANYIGADKYFHARGNYDAANRGAGGRWAAEVISDSREWVQSKQKGFDPEESAADQRANRHGREGGDPNVFRPDGLPDKY